jgi:hypothetical protein
MSIMLIVLPSTRSIILSTVSEKLLDIDDGEITTLNLIHDSLEARMTLLTTIKVSRSHVSLNS